MANGTTFKLEGYRVVVKDGFRATVFKGRRKIGHWVISVPLYRTALLPMSEIDIEVAKAAVVAAKELMRP